MKACNSIAARDDRGLLHRSTSGSSQTGWFNAWRGSVSSWFRPLELVVGQSGLGWHRPRVRVLLTLQGHISGVTRRCLERTPSLGGTKHDLSI